MKKGFYPKLAWTGIRKNRKLYIPYILTCIGMVMMFYIVAFLGSSSILKSIPGGDIMQMMLRFGNGVISVFALIFLFYTNSFLTRRRKKEFGLYNILGMGKWNLGCILIWESLTVAVIALAVGLFAGILFSKFAELGMINILQAEISYSLNLEPKAVIQTLKLFAVIFCLILLNNLRQLHLSNPIGLLNSEHAGERPPKANWLLALAGTVILAAAYWLAVSIKEPLSAIMWFFVAVVMVVVATYLLFIAGSVTICRILQRRKGYYYKTNHFVSVASMVYRMKRNGAGLASICILCTMVLVMLSTVVCLYIGTEDSLRICYPRNISVDTSAESLMLLETDKTEAIRRLAGEVTAENGQSMENVLDYQIAAALGYVKDGEILIDLSKAASNSYSDLWEIFVISLEDYNDLENQNEALEQGEALIYVELADYKQDTVSIEGGEALKIRKIVSDFDDNGVNTELLLPAMYIFVPDVQEVLAMTSGLTDGKGQSVWGYHWFYGFDLDCSDEVQIRIQNQLQEGLNQLLADDEELAVSCEGVAKERSGFYGIYGGLFFLGILLGVVFVFAAVLIMYYKQVSEGYEDQSRFEIMQKVGMTQGDIRRSINSQILTVFFLPLLAAGVHLAFAFPLLRKLLYLFNLTNLRLLISTTVISFLVFALFYILVYRITSKAYYAIVSGIRREKV